MEVGKGVEMNDCFMIGARIALLFNIVCVVLSHPKIYEKVKHIEVLRIMAKIGGADYNEKWR